MDPPSIGPGERPVTPSVRRAAPQDAPELARLLTPLGYATTGSDILARWPSWAAEGNLALVIDGADSLAGVITLHTMWVLHRPRPVGRITALAVDASARGRGFGRRLVQAAEEELVRAGCGLVEVTSHARRVEAHAFYEHLGYERTSARFAKNLAVARPPAPPPRPPG